MRFLAEKGVIILQNLKNICNVAIALVGIVLYSTSHAECDVLMQTNSSVVIDKQQLGPNQKVDDDILRSGVFIHEAKTDEEKARIDAENARRFLSEQASKKYEDDLLQQIMGNDEFKKECTEFVDNNFDRLFGSSNDYNKTDVIGYISFDKIVEKHQLEDLLIVGLTNRFKVFANIIANCAKARDKGWTLVEDDENNVGVIKLDDKSGIQLSWSCKDGDFAFNIEKMVRGK